MKQVPLAATSQNSKRKYFVFFRDVFFQKNNDKAKEKLWQFRLHFVKILSQTLQYDLIDFRFAEEVKESIPEVDIRGRVNR